MKFSQNGILFYWPFLKVRKIAHAIGCVKKQGGTALRIHVLGSLYSFLKYLFGRLLPASEAVIFESENFVQKHSVCRF